MKKLLILLVIITIVFTGISTHQEDNTIIVYASSEQFRNDELQEQLKKKFPDINVYVMYVPTAKAAAKIRVEKENTDADIVMGLDSAYMHKIEGSLADINGISRQEYIPEMQEKSGKFVTWERFAGSFIINKDVIKKYHLDVPHTYEDLLKPEYKNLIAMPDPKSSGTGYFYYKNLVNVLGEKKALEYFDQLAPNIKQFTESGSGPVKLLIQGEIAIGMGMTFQAVSEINEGNDFEIRIPDYGSPYSVTGTGMIKGREKNADIRKIFDYIVNDFMVYDKEHFSPEKVLIDQKNKVPNYPKDITYADMTGIDDIEEKERLLTLWRY